MFPSQPQIGKDMANERRHIAAGFRTAEIARKGRAASGTQTRGWWTKSAEVVMRVATGLRRRLGVPGRS